LTNQRQAVEARLAKARAGGSSPETIAALEKERDGK